MPTSGDQSTAYCVSRPLTLDASSHRQHPDLAVVQGMSCCQPIALVASKWLLSYKNPLAVRAIKMHEGMGSPMWGMVEEEALMWHSGVDIAQY